MSFCGTEETSAVWCNSTDSTGIIFAGVVWLFFIFTFYVMVDLALQGYVDIVNGVFILFLMVMSVWSHLKTMLSDPGAVPSNAHPIVTSKTTTIAMCGRCDNFKPDKSHHDRISNRCISRMDHFCPWTNNSVGAKNQKHFFLFLIYTDLAAMYIYVYLSLHLAFCSELNCVEYSGLSLVLARVLLFVLLFGMLFTSSMVVNQVYGLLTGVSTIDRMKLKSEFLPDEPPVPFEHVFGTHWPTHWLPVDPVFEDPQAVFHYQLCAESFNAGGSGGSNNV